jgi:hypothetical protein
MDMKREKSRSPGCGCRFSFQRPGGNPVPAAVVSPRKQAGIARYNRIVLCFTKAVSVELSAVVSPLPTVRIRRRGDREQEFSGNRI